MLLLFALLVGTTSALNLTCHCLNGEVCKPNGFCTNGCAIGWYGPGCQVGNLALGKEAVQSSTYNDSGYLNTADLAVDGITPIDSSSISCSHTKIYQTEAWWVVTLDVTKVYVINYVTLVNRLDPWAYRLANFVILYSNHTDGNPDPNNSSWHKCCQENNTVGVYRTYNCSNTAIAKRVAVYQPASSTNLGILTLCEVKIYGYEHYDCPGGFTGPGCLLRACDQCGLTDNKCTGDFGSCHYDVCPEKSFLPPYCWITLSSPNELDVSPKATCNSLQLSVVLPDTQPNIAASFLLLEVSKTADRQVVENARRPLTANNSVYYIFSNADGNTSYNVHMKLVYCWGTTGNCFNSTGSKVITVHTGKREYVFSNSASCVVVHARSTTPACELPSSIEVSCKPAAGGGVLVNTFSPIVCGLESEQQYNCSVTAEVNARTIERHTGYIVTERLETSPMPEMDNSVLAGSIGGSIAVVIIIAAIVAIVYRRNHGLKLVDTEIFCLKLGASIQWLKRNTSSPTPAVERHTQASDLEPPSAVYENTLPSFHAEQFDNFYETLHKNLHLQTTGNYDTLQCSTLCPGTSSTLCSDSS